MRINSVNSLNYFTKSPSFKKTAVPYPEYEQAYYHQNSSLDSKVTDLYNKIVSTLFTKEITDESQKIKSDINALYSDDKNPKEKLLSVLA